jgi:teichuronic acid biosynthesis glycosyltransferase TuaC
MEWISPCFTHATVTQRGMPSAFTRPTLLAVGNLVALKRHHLMIEALAQLPGAELVIVGEGPERGAIERLAHQHRVADRVRLGSRGAEPPS